MPHILHDRLVIHEHVDNGELWICFRWLQLIKKWLVTYQWRCQTTSNIYPKRSQYIVIAGLFHKFLRCSVAGVVDKNTYCTVYFQDGVGDVRSMACGAGAFADRLDSGCLFRSSANQEAVACRSVSDGNE